MAQVYRKLAASEEKHAATWEKKLTELKVPIPPRKPTWRAATMIWLARRFGPQFVLPTITSNEKADSQAYDGQPDSEASEFHWKKNRMRVYFQSHRLQRAAYLAESSRNSKDVTKPAAEMLCVRQCSAPTMDYYPF
jgi:hypothetical protein